MSDNRFLLLDFYADWCEPCKWADPIFNEVTLHFKDRFSVEKIDVDRQADVAAKHRVMSVPTFVLLKNGEEVWRKNGFDTAPKMIQDLSQYL